MLELSSELPLNSAGFSLCNPSILLCSPESPASESKKPHSVAPMSWKMKLRDDRTFKGLAGKADIQVCNVVSLPGSCGQQQGHLLLAADLLGLRFLKEGEAYVPFMTTSVPGLSWRN